MDRNSRTRLDDLAARSSSRQLHCCGAPASIAAHVILAPPFRLVDLDFDWDRFVLLYLIRGSGVYVDPAGRPHVLEAGALVQRFPRRRHTIRRNPDGLWAEFALVMSPELYRCLAGAGLVDSSRDLYQPGFSDLQMQAIVDYLARLAGEVEDRRIVKATVDLLSDWYDLDQRRSQPSETLFRIERATSMLSVDLEQDLDLQCVAAEIGLGYHSFRKTFKEMIGVSPGEYRRQRKMERAQRLLAANVLSIKEIAAELGYVDQGAFSRAFKSVAGVSPQAFRRQYGPARS